MNDVNNKSYDSFMYQKLLEERIEELQNNYQNKCSEHFLEVKKYKQSFYNLIKDLYKLDDIKKELMISISERSDGEAETRKLSLEVTQKILSELEKFINKYSDKSFSFLKDINANE